jgi:hypothetical protein
MWLHAEVESLDGFMPTAGTNITLKRFCLRARWTAVQRDARFPPVLELLRQRGFAAPNVTEEWLADAMLPYSEQQDWAESFEEDDLDKVRKTPPSWPRRWANLSRL